MYETVNWNIKKQRDFYERCIKMHSYEIFHSRGIGLDYKKI